MTSTSPTPNGLGTATVPPVVIEATHVSHAFPSRDGNGPGVPVVDDVSIRIHEGEFIALIGPSGCGKSTFLNMIAGMITPDVGLVEVKGRPVTGIDPSLGLGYMFARDGLLPWRTTLENVAYGLDIRNRKDARERARELMALVGLEGFEDHYRHQLSQGMRQRASLARTLATEPDIILLDEPFGALDAQTKAVVQTEFLEILERRKTTVVLVTHDLTEAITLADRVVIMTARPASIKDDVVVPIPRPRSLTETRFDPTAVDMYKHLWAELEAEVKRADLQERARR